MLYIRAECFVVLWLLLSLSVFVEEVACARWLMLACVCMHFPHTYVLRGYSCRFHLMEGELFNMFTCAASNAVAAQHFGKSGLPALIA